MHNYMYVIYNVYTCMYVYVHVYIYIYICRHVYIYIYIYIERERERYIYMYICMYRAPHQGVEGSFCLWIARPGLGVRPVPY